MNDILQNIETAELHTYNTIKIISNLQDTITKLGEDEDTSNIELSQFEKEAEYLKKLAQKIADDLTPPVPNSSSISLATKFIKTKSKSNAINKSPKFIKAKPKKMISEKSQQTCDSNCCDWKSSKLQTCDRKASKTYQEVIKSKINSLKARHKKHKFKKEVVPVKVEPKTLFSSTAVIKKESSLQPTKYLQHILIPIGKINLKNLSTQSVPNKLRHDTSISIKKNKNTDAPLENLQLKQNKTRTKGIENFAKLMQLCMNVKEERESDLEKQIYILEEEMQTVVESNKKLYNILEMLEEHNAPPKVLVKDCSANSLTDKTISSKSDIFSDLPLDTVSNLTSEQITNKLTEDIIKSIHEDIEEITSNAAKIKSQSKLIIKEKEEKPKVEFVRHVLYLEDAIVSMQNKLETAQNKQVELAIQSKAVVEAAHRMTNEPWTY